MAALFSTFNGRLSDASRFTFVDDPTRPVADTGIPSITEAMPPETTLRFELTADVRVPIRLEAVSGCWPGSCTLLAVLPRGFELPVI